MKIRATVPKGLTPDWTGLLITNATGKRTPCIDSGSDRPVFDIEGGNDEDMEKIATVGVVAERIAED